MSSSGAGSGATNITASPIVLISRTGGSAASAASAASRVAILPRSAAGDALAEAREADDVAEADRDLVHVVAAAGGDVLGGDDLLADVLAVVEHVHHAQQLRRVGRQLARRDPEPARVLVLGVALLRDRRVGERAGRRRRVRRRLAEHARRLDQPVDRQAALDERRERPRAEQVELAELGDVARRQRQAGRAPDRLERLEVDARPRAAICSGVIVPSPPSACSAGSSASRPSAAAVCISSTLTPSLVQPAEQLQARLARLPSSPSSSPSASKSGALTPRSAPRTRRHDDRDAVEHGVARERVDELLVGERVRVHAGVLARDARAARRARRGPSRAGARRRPASPRRSPRPSPRSTPARLLTRAGSPSASPSRSASRGCTCSVQRSGPLTSSSRLCIQELFERSWRRPTSTSSSRSCSRASAARRRSTSATIGSGASSIRPLGVRSSVRAGAARAGRGRCRAAPPRARRASARRRARRSRRRTGRSAAGCRAAARARGAARARPAARRRRARAPASARCRPRAAAARPRRAGRAARRRRAPAGRRRSRRAAAA